MRMKKYIAIIAALLMGAVTLTSCKPEEDPVNPQKPDDPTETTHILEVSPTELTFGLKAETKTVTITTNDEWAIELPPYATWFTLSATKGKGKTDVQVTVSNISEGTDYDSYIEISTQWEKTYVFVKQHP